MADQLPAFSAALPDGDDDGAFLRHYHLKWSAVAAAAATLDAPAAYRPPAGYRNLNVYGQIKTTFTGNAVSALALGDAADANRHGDAAAITIGTKVYGKTAAMPTDATSEYTTRVTMDQAATAGEIEVNIEYDLPTFALTYA